MVLRLDLGGLEKMLGLTAPPDRKRGFSIIAFGKIREIRSLLGDLANDQRMIGDGKITIGGDLYPTRRKWMNREVQERRPIPEPSHGRTLSEPGAKRNAHGRSEWEIAAAECRRSTQR
jgi:hypothetical protein